MPITSYHAKYFAYELTRQYSSDSLQKLAASLSDAQVDLNPHQVHQNEVIICSYHFARAKDDYIKLINWDLVIDEAHHLRNVYKNTNKIASTIKTAVAHSPKLLLTATPLQNSLMELYGLVSIIDDYTFGDLRSFKSQFARVTLVFDYSETQRKISILEPLIGKTGWLSVSDLTIESFEIENDILFCGITDDGMALDAEQCQRFFSLPATIKPNQGEISGDVMRTLEVLAGKQQEDILQRNAGRNAGFFDSEMEKLDKWAEAVKNSLEIELKELDKEIKTRKTEAKKILKLEEKVAAQREIKEMEKKRNTLRQNLYQAQDEVDGRKEKLINEIEERIKQRIAKEALFIIRWKLL